MQTALAPAILITNDHHCLEWWNKWILTLHAATAAGKVKGSFPHPKESPLPLPLACLESTVHKDLRPSHLRQQQTWVIMGISKEATLSRDSTVEVFLRVPCAPILPQFKSFHRKSREGTVNRLPMHLGRFHFLAHICWMNVEWMTRLKVYIWNQTQQIVALKRFGRLII